MLERARFNKVQLFVTCLVDAFFPQAGMSVVNVLEKIGFEVEFPLDQTCCGQIAFNGGVVDDAREMAKHTIETLYQTDGYIVIPSGSCGDMILHHYAEIMADAPGMKIKLENITKRTFEFTQFLVDELGLVDLGASMPGFATYHPSCHGLRNLNLSYQSQTLLDHVDGLTCTDLPEKEVCCGFGGLFAVKMSQISGEMLNRKLDNVEMTRSDVLVGSDVSCLMHMAGGLKRRESEMRVMHIAEVLDQSMTSGEEE